MARSSAVVQPYQFDPESDPEGEAPEEIRTLRLQQDVSEWLVTNIMCLDISVFTLFVCVVTQLRNATCRRVNTVNTVNALTSSVRHYSSENCNIITVFPSSLLALHCQ